MLKMIVTFEKGIAVSKLPALYKVIKEYGGEAVLMPQENVEEKNKPTDSKYKLALEAYIEWYNYPSEDPDFQGWLESKSGAE